MLTKLFYWIDMQLVISERAQRSAAGARVSSIPMHILYQGDKSIRSSDIRPFFQAGKPPVREYVFYQVGNLDDAGNLSLCKGRYVSALDEWLFETMSRKRRTNDIWLEVNEYLNVLGLAAKFNQ